MKLIIAITLISVCFMNCANAKIFVLIGPSGVGKSTLINKFRDEGFQFDELVSYTTRPARVGEADGKDYFFISKTDYDKKEQKNEFIISTEVHRNWYGISTNDIARQIQGSRDLVCSLNTEAAKKITDIYHKNIITIFIAPPSFDVLRNRIYQRDNVETPALKIRLQNAHNELKQQDDFDYKIVNDDVGQAVEKLKEIFLTESSSKLIIKQPVILIADYKAIRAMSYNIRMAPFAEDDGNENAWVHRLPKINMIIDQYLPDIIGIQEMSDFQMHSLQSSRYILAYKFTGRCPTKQPIESGLGIAYNTQKLHLISELHTIWLNESQTEANAPAWDGSNYERYAIYAKFKNIETEQDFWFITTHFDHLGIKARQESAKIIMNLAENLDAPAIVTGDFNCFPQLGGQELYQLLCIHSTKMKDSGTIADVIFGVPGSWMGWDYDMYKQRGTVTSKYDFIFVQDTIKVLQHGIIDDYVWDNQLKKALYPSDHRPVISDLYI